MSWHKHAKLLSANQMTRRISYAFLTALSRHHAMGWCSGGDGGGDGAGDGGESDDAGEMNLWHWQSHRTGSRSRRRRSTSLSDFIEGGEAEGDEVRDGLISKHGERQQFVGPFSGPIFPFFLPSSLQIREIRYGV